MLLVLRVILFRLPGADEQGAWGAKAWVPEKFRRTRGRGAVTYLLLEGCHRRLGCTLVRARGGGRGREVVYLHH